ncbi:MAG: NAD-dependent epimerase/dehydratase family protein, partial [Marmoricola sp.]|nr:NAD-dependent epimerase/dehydratase family protein [Marmoricola sp.]
MADAPTTPRRIAVAGGTGLIGRMVVQALRDAGDQPVVMARSHGVDLTDGVGVTEALTGVDAVIDVVNVAALRAQQSIEFFEATTSRLLGAARDAGVGHVVTLSIVGVDRVDLGYYQGKRR